MHIPRTLSLYFRLDFFFVQTPDSPKIRFVHRLDEESRPLGVLVLHLLSEWGVVGTSVDSELKQRGRQLLLYVRQARGFSALETRILCCQLRLQALTVLLHVVSGQGQTIPMRRYIYPGLLEELVDVMKMDDRRLIVSAG